MFSIHVSTVGVAEPGTIKVKTVAERRKGTETTLHSIINLVEARIIARKKNDGSEQMDTVL